MKQTTHPSGADHWTHRTPDRVRRGASAPGAKLSEQQVARIQQEHEQGMSQVALARRYNVSRITIWRHVRRSGT